MTFTSDHLPPTRIPETERGYRVIAERLWRQFHVDPLAIERSESLPTWFKRKAMEWQPGTGRRYRAALAWHLDDEGEHESADDVRKVRVPTRATQKKLPARTSRKKARNGARQDLNELGAALARNGQQDMDTGRFRAALWIQATIITGLRPTEWGNTRWTEVNGVKALVVHNGKHTNGRAHGETRTLIFSRANADQLLAVESQIDLVAQAMSVSKAEYNRLYESVRKAISRETRRLWPRRSKSPLPTLYTARHQFAANGKAYGHSLEAMAALMGHATNETATHHYARASSGDANRCVVDPALEEISRIRRVFHANRLIEVNTDPRAGH